MSLNKFTQAGAVNEAKWMYINCKDVKTETLTTSSTISSTGQPYLEVKLPAGVSIADATLTDLKNLSTVRSVGTNITYNGTSGVFSVVNAGVYNISYSATWAGAGANGSYQGYIAIVTDSSLYAYSAHSSLTANASSNTGSMIKYLSAGASFTIKVGQTTGGALNCTEAHVSVYQES